MPGYPSLAEAAGGALNTILGVCSLPKASSALSLPTLWKHNLPALTKGKTHQEKSTQLCLGWGRKQPAGSGGHQPPPARSSARELRGKAESRRQRDLAARNLPGLKRAVWPLLAEELRAKNVLAA